MSKITTMETHFRARAGSYSTHPSKRGVNLLGWDGLVEERLTCEQERAALVARAKYIQGLFTEQGKAMGSARRKELAAEYNSINEQIRAIRPKLQSLTRGTNIQGHMMDVVKERISKTLWISCYEEALQRLHREIVESGVAA